MSENGTRCRRSTTSSASPPTPGACSARASRGTPVRAACCGSTSTAPSCTDSTPTAATPVSGCRQPPASSCHAGRAVRRRQRQRRVDARRQRRPRRSDRPPARGRVTAAPTIWPVRPQGRLWVGTVDRSARTGRGCSASTSRVRSCRCRPTGRSRTASIGAPDGWRCYHADSMLRRIDVMLLDDAGFPTETHEFARFSTMPDGLTVDRRAASGWRCGRWRMSSASTPDGHLDRTVAIPRMDHQLRLRRPRILQRSTSPALTSISTATHARFPHAGSLFSVDTTRRGRASRRSARPDRAAPQAQTGVSALQRLERAVTLASCSRAASHRRAHSLSR